MQLKNHRKLYRFNKFELARYFIFLFWNINFSTFRVIKWLIWFQRSHIEEEIQLCEKFKCLMIIHERTYGSCSLFEDCKFCQQALNHTEHCMKTILDVPCVQKRFFLRFTGKILYNKRFLRIRNCIWNDVLISG